MNGIVVVTESEDLEERVRRATQGTFLPLPRGPVPTDPAHLFAQLKDATPPQVIVLDCTVRPEPALRLAELLDQQCRAISVVLVSELDPAFSLAALRAGVRDILSPTATVAEIRPVVERAALAAQVAAPSVASPNGSTPGVASRSGRVITVVSPKGGVGKTTVATNLAVGLAKLAPNGTVLVDLDVQFGDVASALNLDPEYTLPDAVGGPASRDTMVLKTFLTRHETGLYVICGAPTPAAADGVTSKHVSRLLEMLASEFHHVVVDTAPGLSEHTLAAMDKSTDLVLVTSMDVPGVRGLRKELDTLTELGMAPDARHIVINFADPRSGLSFPDVAATIGRGIDVTLPRSKAAPGSVNQGIPLLQSGVRDPMTKELRRLVTRLAAGPGTNGSSPRPVAVVALDPLPDLRQGRSEPAPAEAKPRRERKRWQWARKVLAS